MYFPSRNTPEYRQGNADAHRVRPANFRAPALISHHAFWIYSARQQDRPRERDRVKHVIDGIILQIASQARQLYDPETYITPSIAGADILFANFAYARQFQINQNYRRGDDSPGAWQPSAAQRTVFESDHRVVSLHFRWKGCDVVIRFEFLTEYFSITTIAEVGACTLPGVLDRLLRLESFDLGNDPDSIKNDLFEMFWRNFAYDVCREQLLTDSAFSHIFADFRGVVLPNDLLLAQRDNGPRIEALLPLLAPSGSRQGYECSVSYMLGGRALYMTTLGPQLAAYADESRVPITYLLSVANAANRWQRGRLVDLIHTAGASRLAALRDLAALRSAGNKLSGLDHYATAARAAVAQHRQPTNNQQPMPDVARSINDVHTHFNQITESFNVNANTDYGLLYRVERSRYYVARSVENTALMRIGSVEGYHGYDEFIEQRLGGTFDFIDRLGRRYERAVSALSLLDGYHLTIQSNEIALSQKEIALSQADEELEEAEIGAKTLEIQVVGEFILIAALLPYYATGLVGHFYEDGQPSAHEQMKLFTGFIWSLAFIVAIYRSRGDDGALKKLGRGAFLLAAMWIFILTSARLLDWIAAHESALAKLWLELSGWFAKLLLAF